jgi:hypothetical protein
MMNRRPSIHSEKNRSWSAQLYSCAHKKCAIAWLATALLGLNVNASLASELATQQPRHHQKSENQPPPKNDLMQEKMNKITTSEAHQSSAKAMFATYPQFFPEERRQSILDGVVLLGMTPLEARSAGGAFFYKVSADPKRWPANSDPHKVMWAQSTQADSSEIWMTFKNRSQFLSANDVMFRVYFEQGRAVRIEKMEK